MSSSAHRLLVANRGEIAVRILRTAARLNIHTITVYTQADATSPHVLLADDAVALLPDDEDPTSKTHGYLDAEAILSICKLHNVTLVHPGYGFLSEDATFAQMVIDAGITWLGPRPETIEAMGLKHRARELAAEVNVPLVPGSTGLVRDVEDAVAIAEQLGFPVMLKSTAGGGGTGLAVCNTADEVRKKYPSTRNRAETLYRDGGIFVERYYPSARHIEIQIFGDGQGHVIHMGERECSIQRRHQKVIEEAPSPFMIKHPDLRERMCAAATLLAQHVKYESAGTIEFLVDDVTAQYFFLEMNTRLQVEHPVTEQIHPGLDIVELMILQGIAKHDSSQSLIITHPFYDQHLYSDAGLRTSNSHAIEARTYCENPHAQFQPSPGVLQEVTFPEFDWLRVESWIKTGTTITSYFDPLACKLVVTGSTRLDAIDRLSQVLASTKLYGPATNIQYLRAVCDSSTFRAGEATTTFLDTFSFTPRAMTILSGGIETSVQDYPGRRIGMGVPRSGPMDSLSFRSANVIVGNNPGTEGLEITLTGCRIVFHVPAVIAITGAPVHVSVDGEEVGMWARVVVPAGGKLVIGTAKDVGVRTYVAVRGGFPEIPHYLGSKSTSLGIGGHQGRKLVAGDQITLGDCGPGSSSISSSVSLRPPLITTEWHICVLPGPQCDSTFITEQGIADFFSAAWTVNASSNRMGVRLEGPQIAWARENGGEGGAHPSNILDNGYSFGTVNVNGDTPVILTHEGPDMGGYICVCTVATAEVWKLGQLRAGDTIRFKRISYDDAVMLYKAVESTFAPSADPEVNLKPNSVLSAELEDRAIDPRLHIVASTPSSDRPAVVFRQAGDSAILVEFGEMRLDFASRARVHAFETEVRRRDIPGILSLAPCIRSTLVHFDPLAVSQQDVLAILVEVEAALPSSVESLTFPGRRITFPIVLDDRWNREALERYMRTTRATAAYLPSNIEYLARNNGLESSADALRLLVKSDWLVFGVGFYLACPFLIPIDPRCRLIGQKMNPSRTYTPRGAIGIAGPVAAIYPIESPGGYQLFGRTLPPWNTWGRGADFTPSTPWLLKPFDRVAFEVISEEQYIAVEKQFDAGQYKFQIEDCIFSMSEYAAFVSMISQEVETHKANQARGVALEESRERQLFAEWDQRRREAEVERSNTFGESRTHLTDEDGMCITSSLKAHIWKINCAVGHVIASSEEVLIILEAMKTEVNVEAGESNVGRKVKGFGKDISEGASVDPGDVIVVLE